MTYESSVLNLAKSWTSWQCAHWLWPLKSSGVWSSVSSLVSRSTRICMLSAFLVSADPPLCIGQGDDRLLVAFEGRSCCAVVNTECSTLIKLYLSACASVVWALMATLFKAGDVGSKLLRHHHYHLCARQPLTSVTRVSAWLIVLRVL
jgi:hypothetical protein